MQENTSICCSQTASNLSETALGAEVEMVIIYLGVITDQSVSFKMLTENLMFKMKFASFFKGVNPISSLRQLFSLTFIGLE